MTLSKFFNFIANPKLIIKSLIKKLPFMTFIGKIAWDAVSRPEYCYSVFQAAQQAHLLKFKKISVIEFGIGKGNGLIALEDAILRISKYFNIQIDIFGFDLGIGIPKPVDYRDLPYYWRQGLFKMDINRLEKKLKKSRLIIGDVSKTIPDFINSNPAPIGFVAFDLDFYSSTKSALYLFNERHGLFLPRVICYFDDILSNDFVYHSEFTGVPLAIEEFNQKHTDRKIAKMNGLRYIRMIPDKWNEQVFVFHYFSHPLFSKYIYPEKIYKRG